MASLDEIVESLKEDGIAATKEHMDVRKVTKDCVLCGQSYRNDRMLMVKDGNRAGKHPIPICLDRPACRGAQAKKEADAVIESTRRVELLQAAVVI